LKHPMLASGLQDALCNVNQCDINLSFNNMFALIRTMAAREPTMTITPKKASLGVVYYSLSAPSPSIFRSHVLTPTHFQQTVGSVAAGATPPQQVLQSMKLNVEPEYICVYATATSAAIGTESRIPNIPLPISGAKFTINNQSGLMSDSSPEDLWAMSKSNGLIDTSLTFKNEGSVLILRVGKDIVVDGLVAGSTQTFNSQCTLDFLGHQNAEAQNVTVHTVYLTPSTAELSEGRMILSAGYDNSEVAKAIDEGVAHGMSYDHFDKTGYSQMVGGGLFGRLWNLGKKFVRSDTGKYIIDKGVKALTGSGDTQVGGGSGAAQRLMKRSRFA
jgi:hypothetical protein